MKDTIVDGDVDYKALDSAVQKKSVKLVVMHLEKKVNPDIPSINHLYQWMEDMKVLLEEEGLDKQKYIEMRRKLYDAIEWIPDPDIRHSLRNSWYSFGKALEKKVPRQPK